MRSATSDTLRLASPRVAWQRVGLCLAGAWLGALLFLALAAAPTAFALLGKEQAGALVGRWFAQEAGVSLALALLFVMGLRRWVAPPHDEAAAVHLAADTRLWAALGILLCTVVGYYALQPLMSAVRAGQGGPLSFGALHGLSAAFFGAKTLLVGFLAWRLSC